MKIRNQMEAMGVLKQ